MKNNLILKYNFKLNKNNNIYNIFYYKINNEEYYYYEIFKNNIIYIWDEDEVYVNKNKFKDYIMNVDEF